MRVEFTGADGGPAYSDDEGRQRLDSFCLERLIAWKKAYPAAECYVHGLGCAIHLVSKALLKPLATTNKAWARALGEGRQPTLRYGQLLGHAQTLADAGQARYDFMVHTDGSIMTLSPLKERHVFQVLIPAM